MALPTSLISSPALAAIAILIAAGPAFAADPVTVDAGEIASLAQVEEPLVFSPFLSNAVPETSLRRIAGREDLQQVTESNHTATVSDNSVGDNSVTGQVAVSDNAFQNLSGLSIVNINSGNNVAVNAAINVNISMTPGPQ